MATQIHKNNILISEDPSEEFEMIYLDLTYLILV